MNQKMKWLALLLIVTMLLCACGKNAAKGTADNAENTLETTEAPVETTDPLKVILEELKEQDPDGSYVVVGVGEVVEEWDTEESEEKSGSVKSTETTESAETTESTEASTPVPTKEPETEYEKYMAMSAEEQKAFFATFESVDAYFEWIEQAKAEYEANRDYIVIGDAPIEIGEILDAKD